MDQTGGGAFTHANESMQTAVVVCVIAPGNTEEKPTMARKKAKGANITEGAKGDHNKNQSFNGGIYGESR